MWCDNWDTGLAQGEIEVGLREGDLGVGHRVCPRKQLGLLVGAYAIIEPENFYADLLATGTVQGSWALSDRVELYGSIEGLRFEMMMGAIGSTSIGPGYTDVGAMGQIVRTDRFVMALDGKLVLPTAFVRDQGAFPLAADFGADLGWSPVDPIVVHGSLKGMFGLALGGGPLFPAGGSQVDLGVEWRATKGFGLVADGSASFGYEDVVDFVAVGGGVRGAIGPHAGLSLVGTAPLAGRERAQAALDIRFDWRL